MILLINTVGTTVWLGLSTPDGTIRLEKTWEKSRQLSEVLLPNIAALCEEAEITTNEFTAVGVYSGPGSFTSIRIGITVANTLASTLGIPIVSVSEDDAQFARQVLSKIANNEDEKIVVPVYGGEPHITKPRK